MISEVIRVVTHIARMRPLPHPDFAQILWGKILEFHLERLVEDNKVDLVVVVAQGLVVFGQVRLQEDSLAICSEIESI